jgi:hypothetical protein
MAAALFLAISYALALHSLNEWTELDPNAREPISFLLLSATGAIQVAVGLTGRAFLQHRCRLATWGVVFVGLVGVLVGLTAAGAPEVWPSDWWKFAVLGKQVPVTHVALPFAAILITLLACKYQMMAFLLVGLTGLAFSVHMLGHVYFDEIPAWPKLMMSLGGICFFVALYRELRRNRGNTIDDFVDQVRL